MIVALTLLAMVAMVAIVVDGGNAYRERSDVQNAADLAALAAAYTECAGGTEEEARDAGVAQASANGFAGSSEITVVMTRIGEGDWQADVSSTFGTFFAPVINVDTLTVAAAAEAACTPGEAGYAIFAGGQCAQAFTWQGSDMSVTGGIHSNGQIEISGSNNSAIDGEHTSSLTTDISGSGNTFVPSFVPNSPVRPWPYTYEGDQFQQGGSVESEVGSSNFFYSTSKWEIDVGDPEGVYVSEDEIIVKDNVSGQYTFVTLPDDKGKGKIEIGKDTVLDPYYEDLLAFSDAWGDDPEPAYPWTSDASQHPDCGNVADGMALSASGIQWTGVLFAPRSRILMNGSDNSTLAGSIVSYWLDVSGQDLVLNSLGSGGNDPVTVLVR